MGEHARDHTGVPARRVERATGRAETSRAVEEMSSPLDRYSTPSYDAAPGCDSRTVCSATSWRHGRTPAGQQLHQARAHLTAVDSGRALVPDHRQGAREVRLAQCLPGGQDIAVREEHSAHPGIEGQVGALPPQVLGEAGATGTPSRAADSAGASAAASGRLPQRAASSAQPATTPGTVTGRAPSTGITSYAAVRDSTSTARGDRP